MQWQITNDAPVYAQLVAQVRQAIASGAFQPGERLPSVRDMALEAGVNPNTMQRALQELEREGLVFSQRTAGRFVTEEPMRIEEAKRALADAHIERFVQSMTRLGYGPEDIIRLLQGSMKGEGCHGDSGM